MREVYVYGSYGEFKLQVKQAFVICTVYWIYAQEGMRFFLVFLILTMEERSRESHPNPLRSNTFTVGVFHCHARR